MQIFRFIGHVIGAQIGTVMSVGFGAGLIALTLAMISPDFPIIRETFVSARCVAGFPSQDTTCFNDQIAAEREARRLAEAAQRMAETELRVARDSAAGQDLVFVQGEQIKDRISLVVGTIYRDDAGRSVAVRSFCYANLDHGGLDPRVLLSVRDEQGNISPVPITNDHLVMLDATRIDLELARAACVFPDVL